MDLLDAIGVFILGTMFGTWFSQKLYDKGFDDDYSESELIGTKEPTVVIGFKVKSDFDEKE